MTRDDGYIYYFLSISLSKFEFDVQFFLIFSYFLLVGNEIGSNGYDIQNIPKNLNPKRKKDTLCGY